jgi:phosphopentomutase
LPTISNLDGIAKSLQAWRGLASGLVMTNLVEFDSVYGHRNNARGYAQALEETDAHLGELLTLVEKEQENGLLIITADHGNDPTTPSTDHSREYVPLLVFGSGIRADYNLGIRNSFADIAATLSELYDLSFRCPGESFLSRIWFGKK